MGLLIDTGVFVRWEREGRKIAFAQWAAHGDAAISVVTASELLVGVHRANTEERRKIRSDFVEKILSIVPVIEVSLNIAREHAMVHADLVQQGLSIGTHDMWIGATARILGMSVLTTNKKDFDRIAGLKVVNFEAN